MQLIETTSKTPLLSKEGTGVVEFDPFLTRPILFDLKPMLNPKNTKKLRQYLRNHMTKWEVRLWNDLKGKKMYGFKVRRQYGIKNYIIDFYCPQLKLAVEIDGDIHYLDEKIKKDREKDEYLKAEGIKVIRIENLDFEEDYESVILYLEEIFKDRAEELKIELNENLNEPPPAPPWKGGEGSHPNKLVL